MSDALDYLGVTPCGCAVAWASSKLSSKSLAKDIGDWIRRGYDVQRVTTEEARRRLQFCDHRAPRGKQQEMELDA